MVNIEKIKMNPTSVYRRPNDVLHDEALTRADKIAVLQSWAYDQRELQVAEEENMTGADSSGRVFDEILAALQVLGSNDDLSESPPTKQG